MAKKTTCIYDSKYFEKYCDLREKIRMLIEKEYLECSDEELDWLFAVLPEVETGGLFL